MAFCGDKTKITHRINRIEGQVRGLNRMVDEDRNCREILKQVAATLGALRSLGAVVLEDHLTGCVSNAIRGKGKGKLHIAEVVDIFGRPLPEYTSWDCAPIRGQDGTRIELAWKCGKPVATTGRRTVRLRLYMENAKLYAIRFA